MRTKRNERGRKERWNFMKGKGGSEPLIFANFSEGEERKGRCRLRLIGEARTVPGATEGRSGVTE